MEYQVVDAAWKFLYVHDEIVEISDVGDEIAEIWIVDNEPVEIVDVVILVFGVFLLRAK